MVEASHGHSPFDDVRCLVKSYVWNTAGHVRSGIGAYARAARRRVHVAMVVPRHPSCHSPSRRQARPGKVDVESVRTVAAGWQIR